LIYGLLANPKRGKIRWQEMSAERADRGYTPLLSAKDLARILGFGGKKPEKGVYAMVYDGRIPKDCIVRISTRHFMFHLDRIQKKIDEGGF
jgi:hypothetical protein